MSSVKLSSEQWDQTLQFLRSCTGLYVGQEAECRRFIEAMLWVARSGAQWSASGGLPVAYGNWSSVYKRFSRWADQGIWEQMQHRFAGDPDLEHLIIDSTVVRAHPCAAEAPRSKGGRKPRPWVEAAAV